MHKRAKDERAKFSDSPNRAETPKIIAKVNG